MVKKFILVFLLLPIFGFASAGSLYEGRWIHVRNKASLSVEVVRNGADFILIESRNGIQKKFPAKIVEGRLQVSSGMLTTIVVIEEKSGYVLYNGQEYRKLQQGESFEYKPPQIPRF